MLLQLVHFKNSYPIQYHSTANGFRVSPKVVIKLSMIKAKEQNIQVLASYANKASHLSPSG